MSAQSQVTVSIQELRDFIGDTRLRIVDARRRQEYLQGHIPGALSIPVHDVITIEGIGRLAELFSNHGIDGDNLVVVYDDNLGAYSSRVVWSLDYLGHKDVRLLDATYSKWRECGCDEDGQEPEPIPCESRLGTGVNEELLATTELVERVAERGKGVILDVRGRLNYLEAHIPGARSMPWQMFVNIDKDTVFKSRERIRGFFDARGVSRDDEVITYCGEAGTLSCVAFYALKLAGQSNARLYAKSFAEWKRLKLPLERVGDANYWDLSAE